MAFAGVHVACCFAGVQAARGAVVHTVFSAPVWSESLAAAATTTNVAPRGRDNVAGQEGSPVFLVTCLGDSYVAIGPTPNATTGARRYLKAGVEYAIGVNPGDKLACIAVP